MMPPKKSKAARDAMKEEGPAKDDAGKSGGGDAAENNMRQENGFDAEDAGDDVNVFKVEVLYNKRKRTLPAGEQKMHSWLQENFEDKAGQELIIQDMYDEYLGACVSTGTFAVEQAVFMKGIKEEFPNGIDVKESSAHKAAIRVKKPKKERTNKPKVQADSLKIKMKDIIEKALKELGGEKKATVGFRGILKYIVNNYPALRMDLRPHVLVNAIDRGVISGQVELVRGIGKSGVYRLPLTAEEIAAEEEAKKAARKAKLEAKKAEGEGEAEGESDEAKKGEEGGEGDKSEPDNKDEADEKKTEGGKKTRKRKSAAEGKGAKKGQAKGKKKKVPTATLR